MVTSRVFPQTLLFSRFEEAQTKESNGLHRLAEVRVSITDWSVLDQSLMDPNDIDMIFWIFETSISLPETLLEFISEDQTWNHGNHRNRKSIPI